MKRFLNLVICLWLLGLSGYSQACTCGPGPLLTPFAVNSNIVSAHVIRYIENEDNFNYAMELQVSNEFNGSIGDENIVVKGGNGLSCSSYVEEFPVGSEWVFQLSESEETGEIVLGGCYPEMEIVGGEIEGYIRDNSCDGSDYSSECGLEKEKMSIETFDIVQEAYFAGAREGIKECISSTLRECPETRAQFTVKNSVLRIPYLQVYRTKSDWNRVNPRPPIAVFDATLELLEGYEGDLLFNLRYFSDLSQSVEAE